MLCCESWKEEELVKLERRIRIFMITGKIDSDSCINMLLCKYWKRTRTKFKRGKRGQCKFSIQKTSTLLLIMGFLLMQTFIGLSTINSKFIKYSESHVLRHSGSILRIGPYKVRSPVRLRCWYFQVWKAWVYPSIQSHWRMSGKCRRPPNWYCEFKVNKFKECRST